MKNQQQFIRDQERIVNFALHATKEIVRHEVNCVHDLAILVSNQLREVKDNPEAEVILRQYITATLPLVCQQFHTLRNSAIEALLREL